MLVDGCSVVPLKRRRHTYIDPMEVESAKAKLAAAKEKYGREIRVFETFGHSSSPNVDSSSEEPDDFYEFTAEDYYRILAAKKEDILKTRKIREAEAAAHRSKFTKAVIRIRFPDNHTLEINFHPSETMQSLVDFLMKVVARPDLPFYLCKEHLKILPLTSLSKKQLMLTMMLQGLTIEHFADTTPPKKLIKEMSQDFYSAGFIPGAIVYFSYDLPKDDEAAAANSCPFLQEDIISLKGLEFIAEQSEPAQSMPEPIAVILPPAAQESKPSEKKAAKPKWLKM